MPSRRLFITAAAASAVLGAAGVVVSTTVADSDQRDLRAAQHPGAPTASVSPQPLVLAGNRVLFQGDSITDAYRQRGARGPNVGMGRGYAGLVASGVLGAHRGQRISFYNRGVSGDTIERLQQRWQHDTLDLTPDVISLLIGVNDFWGRKSRAGGRRTAAMYQRDLGDLVDRTLTGLPGVRLILCEPFALPTGYVTAEWIREYVEWRAAAAEVASTRKLPFVAFQQLFDRALADHPAKHWAEDGVHPTRAGAALMARQWRSVAGC